MPKAQWDRDRNIDTIKETWPITSFLQSELVRTRTTAFISTQLIGSFTHCKHLPTSGFQNIINMISSNILSLGSFFSLHRSLDTLQSILYDTLNKVFEGSPLYDGHYFKVWTVFAIKKFYCNFISKKPVS